MPPRRSKRSHRRSKRRSYRATANKQGDMEWQDSLFSDAENNNWCVIRRIWKKKEDSSNITLRVLYHSTNDWAWGSKYGSEEAIKVQVELLPWIWYDKYGYYYHEYFTVLPSTYNTLQWASKLKTNAPSSPREKGPPSAIKKGFANAVSLMSPLTGLRAAKTRASTSTDTSMKPTRLFESPTQSV